MRGVQVYGFCGEIAELCVFPDVFYFTRLFKKVTGVPPAKWR
ncbi:MAG: helix-turn-helix domain-containing protein [Christensenellaceae bacterium]